MCEVYYFGPSMPMLISDKLRVIAFGEDAMEWINFGDHTLEEGLAIDYVRSNSVQNRRNSRTYGGLTIFTMTTATNMQLAKAGLLYWFPKKWATFERIG